MHDPGTTLDQARPPAVDAAQSPHGLVRYFQERKSLIRDRTLTVAAMLLVQMIGLAGWWYYSQQQLGRIILTNQGTPLLAQVLAESGDEPVDEPFDVVTRSTLALPAGEYRLRVNGSGRLGRTYRLAVIRGETIAHKLSLDEGRLLGGDIDPSRWDGGDKPREAPMPFAMVTRALELTPGRFDVVESNGRAFVRRDGATGSPVWDTASPEARYAAGRDPGPFLRLLGANRWEFHVMEPAIDFDGDGTRDILVVVGGNGKAFLAVSGQDGSMLWNYVPTFDGPGGPQPEGPEAIGPPEFPERPASLIGWPAIADVDGDGTPDLIATQVFHELPAEVERRTGKRATLTTFVFSRRFVLAISGRSGRWLWTFPVDRVFTAIKSRYWDRPAALLRARRSALLAILDGSQVILVDPANGRPRPAPIDLGFEPVRPIQFADFDGDGEPEILALGPGPSANQQAMAVCSIETGKALWTALVAAKFPGAHEPYLPHEWPWLFDLDGDGRSEVVVPDSGPMPPSAGFRGVRVVDGSTGRTRWTRPMRPETKAEDGLERILDAPDLDGDGVRELVAVSRFNGRQPPATRNDWRREPERIYVDALSGRAGHPLWAWHVDQPENKFAWIGSPRWWSRGPDGWPLLAVPLGGWDHDWRGGQVAGSNTDPGMVHVLEASTGREQNRATGLTGVGAADLDGDGLTDLWGDADGQLRAFRGEPPEAWRALGSFAPARKVDHSWNGNIERQAADLDGDGIADTLGGRIGWTSSSEETGGRTIVARSGRDGRVLWKTVLDPPWLWFVPEPARSYGHAVFPLPIGDLDGDGTPDVVVSKSVYDEMTIGRQPAALPFQLLSGRDGRYLWSAGPLPLGFEAYGFSLDVWSDCRVVEPNALPDILVLHRSPFVKATGTPMPASPRVPTQLRLGRVSGRTGRMVWDVPLEDQPSTPQPGDLYLPKLGDIDGDGSLDAAVLVRLAGQAAQSEFDLKVISLHDGASAWSRVIRYQGFGFDAPSVEIGAGASNEPAAVFVTESPTTPTSNELLVHAIDGRDGADRWTWRSGVGEGDRKVFGGIDAIALDQRQKDSICVTYSDLKRECRVVVLDAKGHERARRVIPPEPEPTQVFTPDADYMIDLDGDGRDELVVWNDNRLNAWGSDLKDRWSIPTKNWQVPRILRESPDGRATLVVPPAGAIDGVTGKLRWTNKPPATGSWPVGDPLDPGDSSRMPRLIVTHNFLPGTVCRLVMPTTPQGDFLPPSGSRPLPGLARDDPRWTRPLPWMNLMAPHTAQTGVFALVGLALLNVFVPLGILWLAAGRRPWSLRALMALPVAAAVPLAAFLALEPLMPIPTATSPLPSSPIKLFALGTVVGAPLVFFVMLAGWSLIRRRWRTLSLMTCFAILCSVAIAAIWLRLDMRDMPAIERYSRSGWYASLLPGAFVVGAVTLIGWMIRGMSRGITRRPPRASWDG